MIPLDETLYLKHTQLAIHPPWMIPTLSFGEDTVLGIHKGQYVKLLNPRGFLLTCQHIITLSGEIGGCCSLCFREAVNAGHPHSDWFSVVCSACFCRCSASLCAQGLCPQHAGQADDGRWYCPLHFHGVNDEISLQDVAARRGKLFAKGVRGLKALFFDEKKLLE